MLVCSGRRFHGTRDSSASASLVRSRDLTRALVFASADCHGHADRRCLWFDVKASASRCSSAATSSLVVANNDDGVEHTRITIATSWLRMPRLYHEIVHCGHVERPSLVGGQTPVAPATMARL